VDFDFIAVIGVVTGVVVLLRGALRDRLIGSVARVLWVLFLQVDVDLKFVLE